MTEEQPAAVVPAAKPPGAVLRNTLVLVGSQLAGVPLSVLLSAAMGRYLGANAFGYLYLGSTLTGFAFLLVEWGHGNVIASAVAQDHTRAGKLLGTTLVWRVLATLVVCEALFALSVGLGYAAEFRIVILLVAVHAFIGTVRAAYQDVSRGFERLDVGAYAALGVQVLTVALVIPTLLLGGKLFAVMLAHVAAAVTVAACVWYVIRSINPYPVRFERASLDHLFKSGSSFLLFGFVMALQPNIDAIFLSKLASPAVLGWQAAAQRLTGFVMMPTTALVAALFPTLSRLYVHDRKEFSLTASRALQGTSLIAIPATLGCALYRGLGAQLFGNGSFKPVEQNLLVLSVLVFLLYFSMPISSAILASGRQRPFAIVQSLCIVSSIALDPLLIPWFQRRYGNGGLGVCVAGVVSEVAVLLACIPLIPEGVVTRAIGKSIGKGFVAGAAMAAVAFALSGITPYVAAPVALIAYVACLWLIGGVDPEHLEAIRAVIARKVARPRSEA